MPLSLYNKKRKFNETPEPSGELLASSGHLRFVVQKHQASHLHYDFRLEMEHVLRSWAVPKGPSLNPQDKRLAMMVEDHPLAYGTFEGHIPEGNYGAGDVIVWDAGTYYALGATNRNESEALMLKGLEAGHVDFFMEGEKLKGVFSLVKFKRSGENAWLLLKKGDHFATTDNILLQDQSVLSGQVVVEKKSKKTFKKLKSKAATLPLPTGIKPMLATLVDKAFSDDAWIFEIKWDGYRAIAEIDSNPHIFSRSGKDFDAKYPEILEALKAISQRIILDGEIVAMDTDGKSNFQKLQNYTRDKKGTLYYYVFDILFLDGEDLRNKPLRERKELLRGIIPEQSVIKFSEFVVGKGEELFQLATEQGIEGVVGKQLESVYRAGGRGPEWVKIKTHKRQETIICGFTEPKGSRHYFGSLVLGVYDNGVLNYVGNSGSGFNSESLKEVSKQLKPFITTKSPFGYEVTAMAPITWVEPKLLCEVEFTEWTEDRQMRHPIFKGLRVDKKPQEVVREIEKPLEVVVNSKDSYNALPMTKKITQSKSGEVSHSSLTHPDKVFWPKEGYTKKDLFDYYSGISGIILPYLRERPQSMLRQPNGIQDKGFFQKNITNEVPKFVDTFNFTSESDGKKIRYLVCNNEQTLHYMVNLGCIELNPWNARIGNVENPDFLILDLDPGEIAFTKVIDVALAIHKLCEAIRVKNYCKTSGKTGLHIVIPLAAKYSHDQSRQFAELLATVIHQQLPKTTSMVRDPKKRQTCIYLDYLQNRIGQTLAAPYSVRPWPGATVSTPLLWKEVNKKLNPAAFTIKTMEKRLKKVGDLWKPVLEEGIDLEKALGKLTSHLSKNK